MNKYIITELDINQNFFHFTNEKNLKDIEKEGLIPFVGHNSRYIEKSKKVFFIEGLDNLLFLFDCWINCYFYIPVIPFIYKLGAYFLSKRWFPMFIADGYFGVLKKSKIQRKRAFKIFDKFLDEGIMLKLDLEENIDFRYDDEDEIKAKGYQKRHLELMGYSKQYSSLENNKMDRWNLHTLTNHGVSKEKIEQCYLNNGKYRLKDIFDFCLEHTQIDVDKMCPILADYLNYRREKYGEK